MCVKCVYVPGEKHCVYFSIYLVYRECVCRVHNIFGLLYFHTYAAFIKNCIMGIDLSTYEICVHSKVHITIICVYT